VSGVGLVAAPMKSGLLFPVLGGGGGGGVVLAIVPVARHAIVSPPKA
jgi:hypothetical protein